MTRAFFRGGRWRVAARRASKEKGRPGDRPHDLLRLIPISEDRVVPCRKAAEAAKPHSALSGVTPASPAIDALVQKRRVGRLQPRNALTR
jgi:hypothetical protein